MSRFINPVPQYKPSSKLYFYKSGTNTQLITYKDSLQTIQNTQPVLTDANGFVPNIFFSGSAKLVVQDQNDVQYIERDPVGGEKTLGNFTQWGTLVAYDLNDIVKGSDGEFYISLKNDNAGNDPLTDNTSWNKFVLLGFWNNTITYKAGDNVKTTDGNIWKSLTSSNIGNNPSTDSVNWSISVKDNSDKITNNTTLHFYRNR